MLHSALALVSLIAPPDLPAETAPEARAAWEQFLEATRPAEPSPITSLEFEVEVVTRTENRSNQAEFTLAYLDPDRLRMRMKSGREQGVGSGIGQQAYWLRDGEELRRLAGREYETDRRQIDDLVNLCHDLCALANPEALRVTELVKLRRGPRELGSGRHAAKKLTWLAFTSPDFRLVGSDSKATRIELGLDPETGLAHQAVVRDPAGASPPRHLIFERHATLDGFQLPEAIHVFDPERPGDPASDFRPRATVEIYLLSGRLNPALAPESFDP